jgi:hypothetical protein
MEMQLQENGKIKEEAHYDADKDEEEFHFVESSTWDHTFTAEFDVQNEKENREVLRGSSLFSLPEEQLKHIVTKTFGNIFPSFQMDQPPLDLSFGGLEKLLIVDSAHHERCIRCNSCYLESFGSCFTCGNKKKDYTQGQLQRSSFLDSKLAPLIQNKPLYWDEVLSFENNCPMEISSLVNY